MLSAASLGLAPSPSTAATAASVGRVACDGRELLVLGTAHTPCASAAEARALVASAKPDVLMLEIDQERLDALLQRGSSLYGVPLGAEFAAGGVASVAKRRLVGRSGARGRQRTRRELRGGRAARTFSAPCTQNIYS